MQVPSARARNFMRVMERPINQIPAIEGPIKVT